MRRRTIGIVGLALFGVAFGAAAADGLDGLVRKGSLRVCTANFAPYAFKDGQGGWIGREIDVARRLAADLGVRPAFIEKPFAQLIPTLAAGGCDVIAASLSIDPERLRRVWFSRPYSESEVRLVVRKAYAGNPLAALDKAETTLAVVAGTVAVDAAKRELPRATIQQYTSLAEARRALEAGAVAALADSTPVPNLLAAEEPERFAVLGGEPLLRTAEGFAVRKGAADLLNYVDGWIEARRRDGFLPATDAYWLESLGWVKRVQAQK